MEDKPEIAAVFKIALENLILTLASELGCSIQGDIDSQVMLKAKGQRIGLADAQLEGFLQISDLHGLPDIGALFTAGQLSFDALMEIREHQTTKRIRKWIREADPLTSEDIVRAYVSSLREKSPVNSLPVKALRFISTTALGAIPAVGPTLGAIGGCADSFLIEKLFPGKLTGLLLDGYRTVVVQARKEHPIQPTSGPKPGRNQPCWCKSGKKYKKCHGR